MTPSLLAFLLKLQEILYTIKTNISYSLIDGILDQICTSLDDILYNQAKSSWRVFKKLQFPFAGGIQ